MQELFFIVSLNSHLKCFYMRDNKGHNVCILDGAHHLTYSKVKNPLNKWKGMVAFITNMKSSIISVEFIVYWNDQSNEECTTIVLLETIMPSYSFGGYLKISGQ